jgi:hypothetical protein
MCPAKIRREAVSKQKIEITTVSLSLTLSMDLQDALKSNLEYPEVLRSFLQSSEVGWYHK